MMRMLRWWAALLILFLVAGVTGCGDDDAKPPGVPGPLPSTSAPAPPPDSTRPAPTLPATTVAEATSVPTVGGGGGPVVDLFYAIHVHTQNEWAPFRDPELTDLDVTAAEGFVTHIEAIAGTLEAHGARGSFHFTFGTAAGLCTLDPAYFDDLAARGHEIGIHAHTNQFLLRAAIEMELTCGRAIGTGSGLAAMAGGPDGSTDATLGESLQVFRDVGATQLLVNMSDHCGSVSSGGNAIEPWQPAGSDVCTDDGAGIIMIDQAPLQYVITDGAPADVFAEAEFSTLAGLAEAAVAEAATLPVDSVAVWGFVTHTNEYVIGASAEAAPQQAALNGLDLLLGRLGSLVGAGRARWSTGAEIAARVG